MPIVQGVGDEVLCAALVAAAPLVIIYRSTIGGPILLVRRGMTAVCRLLGSIWLHVRGGRPAALHHVAAAGDIRAGAGTPDGDAPSSSLSGSAPGGRETTAASQQQQRLLMSAADLVDSPPENEICSVCHDGFTLPVQANCSHWFCGECILRVWQFGAPLAPCRCPICRRVITLLIPSASPQFRQAAGGEGGERVMRDVAKYNRRFGGGPVSFWQRVRDMPLLLRRMAWELADPQRAMRLLHNARILFCLILVVLYVASPLDIISEWVLGVVGLLDDALLLLCVGFYLSILYRATLLLHHGQPHTVDMD